jgi:hypothetical protein
MIIKIQIEKDRKFDLDSKLYTVGAA